MTKKKHGSSIQKRLIPSYIFLVIVSFISVFPFFWMISAATNKSIDIARGRIAFGGYALENLKKLFASQNVALGMKNSLINATVQTIIALLVCSLAGYGFELYHDKAKDKLFSVLLLAMMIPQVATLIPLFKMMSKLGFINTVWGFMLPAISTPFLIMMFRQNSRNFPVDIMEAARIDGLSEIGIFFKMYMPVQKSTYAAAAVITFMNAWNSYLWPKVILNKPDAITMPMLIANLAAGYTVDLEYASNDISTQVSQVENMISNGCELLVIASIDGESLGTPLQQAKDAGIPVIAYDRLLMNSDAVSYYATFDNYMVGTKQGEYIVEALDLLERLQQETV